MRTPTTTTNNERAETAKEALWLYIQKKYDGVSLYNETEDETPITDLIADLLHLAKEEGFDPEQIIRMAQLHFEAEHDNPEETGRPRL